MNFFRTLKFFAVVMLSLTMTLSCEKQSNDPSEEVKELPTSDELLVGSFNVRVSSGADGSNSWTNRRDAAMKYVKEVKPDLMGMQELKYNQSTDFAKSLSADYEYYNIDRDTGLPIVSTGGESCGLIYKKDRFLLVRKGFFWLADDPDHLPEVAPWGGGCRRIVTWVWLKDRYHDGKEVFFFNTHFDHKSTTARLNASKLIVSKIQEIVRVSNLKATSVVFFVTGDLNCKYGTEDLQPMINAMYYARTQAPITTDEITYNGFGGTTGSIIDHIFYGGSVIPQEYRVVTENYGVPYISDHYPILFKSQYK